MNRSRVIGTLLGLILVACMAVIVLDQLGAFGCAQNATTPTPASPSAPVGTPSTGDGYGDLK